MKNKEVKNDSIVCKNYSKTNDGFEYSPETEIDIEESIPLEEKLNAGMYTTSASSESGHRIEWKNLSFKIDKRVIGYEAPFKVTFNHLQKQILKPQSGCIYSGQMTALMGPSGSGKTTLLNCITGRINSKGILTGDVNYIFRSNSSKKNGKLLKLSYVPQKDYLYQDFTIRETLKYAYKFTDISNNKRTDDQSIKARLEKLASDLNLLSALDTKISKCSGGQVKRVSVAIELVSSPNILILDEPTTGLDSMNASTIISVIKDLLSRRKSSLIDPDDDVNNNESVVPAVICAIHQPSVEVFNLFDSIYVLSEGGNNIFSGPPSNVPKMLAMNNINISENATNPADFLLMLCQSKENIKKLTAPLIEENNDGEQIMVSLSEAKKETDRSYSNSHYFKSVGHLLSRNIKLLRYNPSPILIRSLFCVISSMIMNGMYDHAIGSHDGCYDEVFGFGSSGSNRSFSELLLTNSASKSFHDSLKRAGQILDNVSFLLISTMFILEIHSLMTVIEIPTEIKIISKEVANHWYGINSYITSRLLITFVAMFIHISLFAAFAMLITSQLLQWNRYLYLATVWIMLAWISELTGFIFGVLFHDNLTSAILVTIAHSFPIVFFGGFFVKSANTPIYFLPFTWISHIRHVFEALMITTYGLGRCADKVNDGKLSFAELLESSPMQLVSKLMEVSNITHEASKYISPLLGLPDEFCVAQIINGTRDYLGLPSPYPTYDTLNTTDDYNYDDGGDLMNDTEMTKSSVSTTDISFPLSLFGIEEKNFERCFYSLFIILIIYKIITLIILRRLVRVTF